jgi:hypothetical protein
MVSPGQLRLSLPSPSPADGARLPPIALAGDWKTQPRTWPHALHPMCTYLGSLPAALAHDLIARWSRPGDVVLDPFCGRGTVPLQAGLERRVGVGIDRNPLAHLLTAAALAPPTRQEARGRLGLLRIRWTETRDDWREVARSMTADDGPGRFFHPETLAQLLLARAELDRAEPVDAFLLAAIAGILHGRRASALTDAMPNMFSMAPGYAARWLSARDATTGTGRPARDLFGVLAPRLDRLLREGGPVTRGIAISGDAREAGTLAARALRARGLTDKVRLIVTSPPYLGLVRYGRANWLRLWLLGEDPTVVDGRLDRPTSAAASGALLRHVLDDVRPVLSDDAVVVIIVGDIESDRGRRLGRPVDLAAETWATAAAPAGSLLAGVSTDAIDPARKLTRLWGGRAGYASRTDHLLVISPTELGRRRALASAGLAVDPARTLGTAPAWRRGRPTAPGPRPAVARPAILGSHAADVPPGRPGIDGPARPDEEPRPRPDDRSAPELHPAAAGAPIPA